MSTQPVALGLPFKLDLRWSVSLQALGLLGILLLPDSPYLWACMGGSSLIFWLNLCLRQALCSLVSGGWPSQCSCSAPCAKVLDPAHIPAPFLAVEDFLSVPFPQQFKTFVLQERGKEKDLDKASCLSWSVYYCCPPLDRPNEGSTRSHPSFYLCHKQLVTSVEMGANSHMSVALRHSIFSCQTTLSL